MKWTLETNQLLSPPTVAKNKLILHVTEVTAAVYSDISSERKFDHVNRNLESVNLVQKEKCFTLKQTIKI